MVLSDDVVTVFSEGEQLNDIYPVPAGKIT